MSAYDPSSILVSRYYSLRSYDKLISQNCGTQNKQDNRSRLWLRVPVARRISPLIRRDKCPRNDIERVCDSVTLKIMAAAFDNALTGEHGQKAATPPKPQLITGPCDNLDTLLRIDLVIEALRGGCFRIFDFDLSLLETQ
jgi:hypothetical protein